MSERGLQIVAPYSLKGPILDTNHYSLSAGHPGGRKLRHKIRKDFYWRSLSVDCYATVWKVPQCTNNRINSRKNVTKLQVFPTTEPLSSVCIDCIGRFIRTPRKIENFLVITDRFTKLTKPVSMKRIFAAQVAKCFVNTWAFNYNTLSKLLSYNGGFLRQSISKTYVGSCQLDIASPQHTTTKRMDSLNITIGRCWHRYVRT